MLDASIRLASLKFPCREVITLRQLNRPSQTKACEKNQAIRPDKFKRCEL